MIAATLRDALHTSRNGGRAGKVQTRNTLKAPSSAEKVKSIARSTRRE